MYSVLRIVLPEIKDETRIEALREAAIRIDPESVTSLGICFEVADGANLCDHFVAFRELLPKAAHIISDNSAFGGRASLDLAIYLRDYGGLFLTELICPADVMGVLAASKIDWVISIYGDPADMGKSPNQGVT